MISEHFFRADLHCHSHYSDGTDSPQELIRLAIEKGLSGLSITDHDTVLAYQEAVPAAQALGFPLLTGVEFSASFQNSPIHVLGYGFSLTSSSILELCEHHRKRRRERLKKILEKLRKLGISIDEEEFREQAQSLSGSIGRPHIAAVLVKKNIVRTIKEGFDRYLGDGKPAYDPGELVSVEETIKTIHEGNGVAVLAHPHLIKKSTVVKKVLEMPFDGIEAYYARLPLKDEKRWLEIGKSKGWVITGGSDYHGSNKIGNILGSSWVNKETFEFLYARAS